MPWHSSRLLCRIHYRISARDDTGVDEVLIELFKLAPQGEPIRTEPHRPTAGVLYSEIIREKVAAVTEEIPTLARRKVADPQNIRKKTGRCRCIINVERETQKGIVVGRGGEGIKRIRQAA